MTRRKAGGLLSVLRGCGQVVAWPLALATLMMGGCAEGPAAEQLTVAGPSEPAPPPPAAYALTDEEKALDCKRLTGRMQVRILQIRDFSVRPQSSAAAYTVQGAARSVLGGGHAGADPNGQYARDRAQLEAYNAELAAKHCRTFNLDDELKPKPVTATPTPSRKK
ncbi:MAG: hypothetical protein WC807_20785 [Hyphomicrobium sp.]|jgi:hypothetical protein